MTQPINLPLSNYTADCRDLQPPPPISWKKHCILSFKKFFKNCVSYCELNVKHLAERRITVTVNADSSKLYELLASHVEFGGANHLNLPIPTNHSLVVKMNAELACSSDWRWNGTSIVKNFFANEDYGNQWKLNAASLDEKTVAVKINENSFIYNLVASHLGINNAADLDSCFWSSQYQFETGAERIQSWLKIAGSFENSIKEEGGTIWPGIKAVVADENPCSFGPKMKSIALCRKALEYFSENHYIKVSGTIVYKDSNGNIETCYTKEAWKEIEEQHFEKIHYSYLC